MEEDHSGGETEQTVPVRKECVQPSQPENWSGLLAEMAISQDKTLYIQLYRNFAPKVKAYILRLGVVEATAEELTQEAMLSMWRKAHLYKPEKAAASTWIFTLARNQSIDWMRRQKYPEYSLDHWHESAEVSLALDTVEQTVMCDRIGAVINELPESQSQVIYMSFFEGRSHSEIAEKLKIPLGSVKSRIRLAAEKLKLKLRGEQ
jgi:RNA polymerase sigma-70 factor, ECF subfamily